MVSGALGMESLGKIAARLLGALVLCVGIWLVPMPAAAQELPPLEGYYVVENGQAVGPLPASEIEARVRDGRLSERSLVWRQGMNDWEEARFRPDLGPLIGSPRAAEADPAFNVRDFGTYLQGSWTSDPAQTDIPDMGQASVVNTIAFGANGTFRSLTKMSTVPGAPQPMSVNVEGTGTYTLSGANGETVTISFLGTSLTKIEGQPGNGFPDQLQFDATIKAMDQSTFIEDGSTYRKAAQ